MATKLQATRLLSQTVKQFEMNDLQPKTPCTLHEAASLTATSLQNLKLTLGKKSLEAISDIVAICNHTPGLSLV